MSRRRSDTALLVLTGACVAGIALVAGAISFAHMRELATQHDQAGWKSFAFPISVDGLEIVASLYLLARRRVGRPPGWIPWVALVVGTAASLSANIGVGGADLIGKALAGWPALSMLVSVKLLFSMFDHDESRDPPVVRDGQRPSPVVPAVPGPSPPAATGTGPRVSAERLTGPAESQRGDRGDGAVSDDIRDVAHLIPAAREAHGRLAAAGRSLSRDALAAAMREQGDSVSNAHASVLLKVLKAEEDAAPFAARATGSGRRT